MSLNFNNTQIENVIFNGTELDKVYMNNVLVFEKNKPVYKRRIMVGDNLKGVTVYADFPLSFKDELISLNDYISEDIISIKNKDTGILLVIDPYITNDEGVPDCWVNVTNVKESTEKENNFYGFSLDSNTEFTVEQIKMDNIDLIVSSIKETPKEFGKAYRHLYIEDKNIRPIQVGDKIKTGTKMYFNFPDKFSDEEKNTFSNGDCGFRIVELNDSINYIYELYISKGTINNDPNGEEYFEFSLDFLNDSGNWVEENRTDSYIYMENPEYNQSYLFFSSNLLGEIRDIHSTLKKYILVDTTTLG